MLTPKHGVAVFTKRFYNPNNPRPTPSDEKKKQQEQKDEGK